MTGKLFVPKPECMVASGDCFELGKCLAQCSKRAFYQHQRDLREMYERMARLESRIIKVERKP